jgi:uncharacterized SAM-binding protein YcdF (DUF218 family)
VTDALVLFILRVVNFGVVLPFILGCSVLAWAWYYRRWQAWLRRKLFHRVLWRLTCIFLALGLLSVCFFFIHIAQVKSADVPIPTPKALLILGSGTPNCQASPTLTARLEKGIELAVLWPNALIVVSGGMDWALRCTEGQVMGNYLRAKGVSATRILQEEKSTSTHENLHFSLATLGQQGMGPKTPIILVTSDFHTLRTKRIALRAGYEQVSVVGVPTPLYLRYNAWLREYFAFISGWLLDEY